jgi:hypothetical protein
MTNQGQRHNRPTKRQMEFLKDLRRQTGCNFGPANTFDDAKEQIELLLAERDYQRSTKADRRIERREATRSLAEESGDAAAFRDDELAGYGPTATWGGHHG